MVKKLMILAVMMIGVANMASPIAVEKQESRSFDIKELSLLDKQSKELDSYLILSREDQDKYAKAYKEKLRSIQLRKEQERALRNAWKGKLCNFFKALGANESGNDYTAYNKYGYIGRYQFGKSALETTGYGYVTLSEFKKNPAIFDEAAQYDAMVKFTKINKRTLRKYIKKYSGTYINDILVTESGILAGAHLGGAGGVIKYLESGGNYNPSDAYNTSIENYLKKFSGYNVNLA